MRRIPFAKTIAIATLTLTAAGVIIGYQTYKNDKKTVKNAAILNFLNSVDKITATVPYLPDIRSCIRSTDNPERKTNRDSSEAYQDFKPIYDKCIYESEAAGKHPKTNLEQSFALLHPYLSDGELTEITPYLEGIHYSLYEMVNNLLIDESWRYNECSDRVDYVENIGDDYLQRYPGCVLSFQASEDFLALEEKKTNQTVPEYEPTRTNFAPNESVSHFIIPGNTETMAEFVTRVNTPHYDSYIKSVEELNRLLRASIK